jgi:transcriptional regulator with XRE-family HTH domain
VTGSELKKKRTELTMTQEALANALGVATNTVARWERDEVDIPNYLELALKQLITESKKKR